MMYVYLFFFALFTRVNISYSRCENDPFCRYSNASMTITCDPTFANDSETDMFPVLSCYPPVNTYLFRNFKRIQPGAFENIKFPENQSFLIKLTNISMIDSDAFSTSIIIPANSKLSIEIEHVNNFSSITLKPNAFNYIKIDHLKFSNLNRFNGRPVFDTSCFGTDLDIHLLTFEHCGITGFSDIIRKSADVDHLSIKHCPSLTQLTDKSLPSFLSTSKSLEISNTNLQIINAHTFQAWTLILEELILSHNLNFEILPSTIVDGVLMNLKKFDLSYNSIKTLDLNYNWHAYSYTTHLLLKNQQLDLFLKTNILKALSELEIIDFSYGFISENNDDLIKNFFPNMSNLISIDISYTNLTENMIIDLLTQISQTTNRFTNIYLYGLELTDENFCSYFKIFQSARNLVNLQLDESHECNCVVDLFYAEEFKNKFTNESMVEPICLSNSSRTRCNIETQLSISKCNVNGQNPGGSNTDDGFGKYAFGAIVGGVVVLVLIVLSLGFGVYRIRNRRNTDLFMEKPIENPLNAIIEERL